MRGYKAGDKLRCLHLPPATMKDFTIGNIYNVIWNPSEKYLVVTQNPDTMYNGWVANQAMFYLNFELVKDPKKSRLPKWF